MKHSSIKSVDLSIDHRDVYDSVIALRDEATGKTVFTTSSSISDKRSSKMQPVMNPDVANMQNDVMLLRLASERQKSSMRTKNY